MSKKIKLKLLPNGEIHIETLGIKGKKCLNYIDILNKLVGAKTIKTELTQEYYESEENVIETDRNQINNTNNY